MINQVLVAVDGSPLSLRATRLGAKILQQNTSGVLSLLYIAKLQSDLREQTMRNDYHGQPRGETFTRNFIGQYQPKSGNQ